MYLETQNEKTRMREMIDGDSRLPVSRRNDENIRDKGPRSGRKLRAHAAWRSPTLRAIRGRSRHPEIGLPTLFPEQSFFEGSCYVIALGCDMV